MAVKTITMEELPSEIDKIYENLITATEKIKISAPRKAGQFMIKVAKKLSPYVSGTTKTGISGAKSGKGYKVISYNDSPFPYNYWLDNRITVNAVKYPNVQRTGVEGGGFFTKARNATEDKFKDIIVKRVNEIELVK